MVGDDNGNVVLTHRVHKMGPLLVAETGQVFLGEGEDLALVNTSELGIAVEVLLVQRLQSYNSQFPPTNVIQRPLDQYKDKTNCNLIGHRLLA